MKPVLSQLADNGQLLVLKELLKFVPNRNITRTLIFLLNIKTEILCQYPIPMKKCI